MTDRTFNDRMTDAEARAAQQRMSDYESLLPQGSSGPPMTEPTFNDRMADPSDSVASLLNEIGPMSDVCGLLPLVRPIVLLVMFLAADRAGLALDPVDGKWRAKP